MGFVCGQTFHKMADYSAVLLGDSDVPGATINKDPAECNVETLQRWLECHGQKKGGRKSELVERVCGCLKLNIPVDPKVDGGKWYELKKETAIEEQNLPASNTLLRNRIPPSDGWRTFPSRNLPINFNYGHVYHYLVESIKNVYVPEANVVYSDGDNEEDSIDVDDAVTAKPLRKGRWLLKSSFIENTQDNFDQKENLYIIRSHVQHSMKKENPLNVNLFISNASGYIDSASCDCKASSLGRCSHVAAVLLMLSDTVIKKALW